MATLGAFASLGCMSAYFFKETLDKPVKTQIDELAQDGEESQSRTGAKELKKHKKNTQEEFSKSLEQDYYTMKNIENEYSLQELDN